MAEKSRYAVTLAALETSARVEPAEQVEEQPAHPPREYLDQGELDRLRLLANPAGAGRY